MVPTDLLFLFVAAVTMMQWYHVESNNARERGNKDLRREESVPNAKGQIGDLSVQIIHFTL